MASAIVVYFMVVSFVVYIGDNRTLTIKFFFSAIAFLGPYPNAWRRSDSVSAGYSQQSDRPFPYRRFGEAGQYFRP
jgi:hypothetical protein